ncbi:MAG: glycosyltransferase, partial [Elusimicrobia bacterium]|nr:glycosyltransferase [Elusimicrobiota bacterium]
PIGVDPEYFKPVFVEDDYPSVIFRGIMNFLPNTDAALYFYKDILPLVEKEIPEIKYYIVGKCPTEQIRMISNGRKVVVTGYVEDIRPYIAKASLNVCPMRIGTGMKYKIIEAMALGTPTIAASFACAGIPELKNGENIVIADTPADFAGSVVRLLKDKNLRRQISANGRKVVLENYTWKNIASKFENMYLEAIEKNSNKLSNNPII